MKGRLTIIVTMLPALGLALVLFGASIVDGVGQSLGWLPFIGQDELRFDAYRNLLSGPDHAAAFWAACAFSLWVSGAATLLSAAAALGIVAWLGEKRTPQRRALAVLNLNLAFPHLVWAIGLGLLLAQSGFVARLAAAAGLIDGPAEFPVLVRDRFGFGIILAYVSKETPFLLLMLLSILRSHPAEYATVAENLGANRWQRLRYVLLPLVAPGLLAGSLLVFAFVFGAYEVPAVLGVRYPEMLAVLAMKFFLNPDLRARAEGMAVSVLMALVVLGVAAGALWVSARLRGADRR